MFIILIGVYALLPPLDRYSREGCHVRNSLCGKGSIILMACWAPSVGAYWEEHAVYAKHTQNFEDHYNRRCLIKEWDILPQYQNRRIFDPCDSCTTRYDFRLDFSWLNFSLHISNCTPGNSLVVLGFCKLSCIGLHTVYEISDLISQIIPNSIILSPLRELLTDDIVLI